MGRRLRWPAQPLLFVTFMVLCSACTADGRGTQSVLAASDDAPVASPLPAIDCDALVRQRPASAADFLLDAGYSIAWREVITDENGVTTATVIASPQPDGAIADIILDGRAALIFVASAGDDALVSPPPPTC